MYDNSVNLRFRICLAGYTKHTIPLCPHILFVEYNQISEQNQIIFKNFVTTQEVARIQESEIRIKEKSNESM